jgi:hypothetical protein
VSGWYVGTVGPVCATVCGADGEFARNDLSEQVADETDLPHAREVSGRAGRGALGRGDAPEGGALP